MEAGTMQTLTPRQQQAYELRCAGKSLREIAEVMATTQEPVRNDRDIFARYAGR